MNLSRRNFLKLTGLSAAGAVACNFFDEREMTIESPVDLPEDLVTGTDNWYATLCHQCPEREGVLVRIMEGRAKKVRGNPLYPTNQGVQSSRCEAGLQALYHPDRIAGPLERSGPRGSGQFIGTSWEAATDRLVRELGDLGDPSAMLMIADPSRGHLGMVERRFVETLGGRYLPFEALEYSVLRQAMKEIFDQEILPDFDIGNARYLLSFGADFLSTWVAPVHFARGYGRFRDHGNGVERGTFVHADPRYSMTAASADQWLPITPGTEGALALGLARVIIEEDLGDAAAVAAMSGGAGKDGLLSALEAYRPEGVVAATSMPETIRGEAATEIIRRVAREFATRRPSLAIAGGEAAAQTNGLFNLSAVFALNFLVGSVGRRPGEGGIVFNPAPPLEGLLPGPASGTLTDWRQVAGDLGNGKIKLLIVRGANPVHGLPQFTDFRGALDRDDLFVVSASNFLDDTTQMADLVIPDGVYLEQWGTDVPEPGPGYQVVGWQQPTVNPLSPELDPRSFPDVLLGVVAPGLGLNLGLPGSFREVLRDGARELFELKSGAPNGGSGEAATFGGFWNALLQQGGWWDTGATSSASAPAPPNLAALAALPSERRLPSFTTPDAHPMYQFYLVPFLSNSLLDGRGAHLPWLQAAPDPMTTVTWQTWIEINSRMAREMDLKEGDVVDVVSTEGNLEAIVYPLPAIPPGVVAIPIGQGHVPGVEYATRDGETRGANPISILAPQLTESGSLAWGATRVRLRRTGRNVRVSKFEGIVPAFPIGTRAEDIIQVTNG